MKINVLAVDQKGVRFFVGVMRASELLPRAKVDAWSPGNPSGYQRPLVEKRIAEVAWYLMEGEGVFPTSLLVSVRDKRAKFTPESPAGSLGFGTLELPDDTEIWIIDGQHRDGGLKEAIERGERSLQDYEIPVTFFLSADKFTEMRYFYLVNSRAKSVPTDIVDRILQQTAQAKGELWLQEKEAVQSRRAERAALQARATNIVDYLRSNCPVWQDMVEVPGEPKPSRFAVRQHALVSAFLEGPLKDTSITRWPDKDVGELLDRYWRALSQAFPEAFEEPENYSIQRSIGIYSLHMIFPDVFERCREAREYSQEKMAEVLAFMGLDSKFWHRDPEQGGDPRTFGSGMRSVRLLAAYLRSVLPRLTLAGV